VPSYHCPTCDKFLTVARKEDAVYRPFCSERCKMVDLGRWLDGTYAIRDDAHTSPIENRPPDDGDLEN